MALSIDTIAYMKAWVKKHASGSLDTSVLGGLAFKNSAKGKFTPEGHGMISNPGKLPELKMSVQDKNLLIEFDNGELPGSDVLFAGNEAQISVQ